jgi:hypothetical protein
MTHLGHFEKLHGPDAVEQHRLQPLSNVTKFHRVLLIQINELTELCDLCSDISFGE